MVYREISNTILVLTLNLAQQDISPIHQTEYHREKSQDKHPENLGHPGRVWDTLLLCMGELILNAWSASVTVIPPDRSHCLRDCAYFWCSRGRHRCVRRSFSLCKQSYRRMFPSLFLQARNSQT